jgi:hypothetical protein
MLAMLLTSVTPGNRSTCRSKLLSRRGLLSWLICYWQQRAEYQRSYFNFRTTSTGGQSLFALSGVYSKPMNLQSGQSIARNKQSLLHNVLRRDYVAEEQDDLVDVTRRLIQVGCDPSAYSSRGKTPLDIAVAKDMSSLLNT